MPRRLPLACLLLVVLLGAVPRLWALGTVPAALHPDEAATAADARAARSGPALAYAHERGGWVEGTYVWLAAPAIALADRGLLSLEAAARLPASLAGCLLVLALGWAARELSGSWRFALGTALCAALLPWGWHFSHLALRGTLTPLLVALGLGAAVRSLRARRAGWALAAGVAFSAALATYPPLRLQVPLLLAAFALLWRDRLQPRLALALLAPPALAFLLLLPWTLWGPGGERLDAVLAWDGSRGLGANLVACAKGYSRHFGTRFLFSGSSSRGFAPEGLGLVPRWQGVLFVLGLVVCLRRRWRVDGLVLALVLLFPLGAALTQDVPNAMRAVLGLVALPLLAGRGLQAVGAMHRAAERPWVVGGVVLTLALCAGWVAVRKARYYFQRYPVREAAFYHPGRRELVRRAAEHVARGHAVRCKVEFLDAARRLYAPDVPARREGDRWLFGGGPARVELRLVRGRLVERRLR